MNEHELREQDLADVTGGADGRDFPRLAADFARANGCANCSYKQIYRQHEMCMEVYSELLQSYTSGKAVEMRCARRG